MAYDDLRDWIAALDRAGELKKIRTEVDRIIEEEKGERACYLVPLIVYC